MFVRAAAILFVSAVLAGCSGDRQTKDTTPVHTVQARSSDAAVPSQDATVKAMLDDSEMQAIRSDRIQFVTMRPPGSKLPTLERKVKVIAPPEAVALATRGDVAVLDALVPLLADPQRAWAAEVMLAAMTGHEADIVNSFQAAPDDYFETVGGNGQQRWQAWLDEHRARLRWDAEAGRFTTR